MLWLTDSENIFNVSLFDFTEYTNVTDKQLDTA